jgi:UDP-N-acetylmuramyl pentapeptide synthase
VESLIRITTELRQELFPERQLIFCLGEMRELGQYSQEVHEALAAQIVHADQIFLIGQDPHTYTLPALEKLGYANHRIQRFNHPTALGKALDEYISQQSELSVILFK